MKTCDAMDFAKHYAVRVDGEIRRGGEPITDKHFALRVAAMWRRIKPGAEVVVGVIGYQREGAFLEVVE